MEAFRDGYFMLEDYPHACRYSIHSGPFFLASFKAIAPGVVVYPEMYNETGDKVPCPDAAVARAWPSYGMWSGDLPINATIKRVLEYVYACVWHGGQGFSYWQDHGFHTRVWERERFEALLRVWGFVDKTRPRRPWKANAFVCNEDCCRNHPLHYDEYPGDDHGAYGDLFNTAEECSAYCYEMSRTAGQNAGFVTDFAHLSALDAADIDTLVLPPLTQVTAQQLDEIRRPARARRVAPGLRGGRRPGGPVRGRAGRSGSRCMRSGSTTASPATPCQHSPAWRSTPPTAPVSASTGPPRRMYCSTRRSRCCCSTRPAGEGPPYTTSPRRRSGGRDQYNRVAYGRASISRLIKRGDAAGAAALERPGRRDQRGQDHRLRG